METATMLSEVEQKIVWEGMLAAEIRADYFADLASKYRRRQRYATWLAFVLSSGAVALALANLSPGWIRLRLAFPVLAAITTGYSLVMQNDKFALDAVDLHSGWNELSSRYQALWHNLYADDARELLDEVQRRGRELSKAGAQFKYDEKAMLRWQLLVEKHHIQTAA